MDNNLNELSLFAGIGGLSLGLKMADSRIRTVAYCEIDRYCQGVLLSRMSEGKLDNAPIWDDIRTLKGEFIKERIDIISGGFPCQDLSIAGKRAGIIEGNRSGLWFEYFRLICEIRPRFVFVENVSGLLMGGLGIVLANLAESGYHARWLSIRASDVGIPQQRERVFCLAYSQSVNDNRNVDRRRVSFGRENKSIGVCELETLNSFGDVAPSEWKLTGQTNSRPLLVRSDNGNANWFYRLSACGNAVVPQQAAKAWEILSQGIDL